jgi:PIN domain nuclease of toxin-antitoxin system
VRLLLDTHVLIWWLEGGARLGKQARAVIGSRANEVRVGAGSDLKRNPAFDGCFTWSEG